MHLGLSVQIIGDFERRFHATEEFHIYGIMAKFFEF
jgi:hypothetical protein